MRKAVILATLAFGFFKSNAQSYQWGNVVLGTSSAAYTNTVDASGNIIAGGTFLGTADFNPGGGFANLTSSSGVANAYIQKLSSTAGYTWALAFTGTADSRITGVTTDASGNVYATGYFSNGNIDLDPGAGVQTATTANVGMFVVKLNSAGTLVWAKSVATGITTTQIYGLAIGVRSSGEVWVGGRFKCTTNLSPLDFDPGAGTSTSLSTGIDGYVLRLDASGNWISNFNIAGGGTEAVNALKVDASDNVYLGGEYSSGLTTYSFTGIGGFVSKYNTSNSLVWAKSISSSAFGTVYGLDIDVSGNVFSVGDFSGTADMDPSASTLSFAGTGSTIDGFILKLDNLGSLVWAKQIVGNGNEQIYAVSVKGSYVNVCGSYSNSIDLDPSSNYFAAVSTTAGTTDACFAKYSPSTGDFLSGQFFRASSNDEAMAVSATSTNDYYLAGYFNGTIDFNTASAVNNLTATGTTNVFNTKYSHCAPPGIPSITNPSGQNVCNGASAVLTSSDPSSSWYANPSTTTTLATGVTYTSPALGSSTTYYLEATNTCGSPSSRIAVPITIINAPSAPGAISGTTTICSGSSNTYSVAPVSGATSYNWTLPSGWTGSSTSNTISATASSTSGNISVSATNSCFSSSSAVLAITVNPLPSTPSAISGAANVCAGTVGTYSVTNVSGVTYNWTLPSGWTGSSTSNSISATASSTSGNITVTATNSCGTSGASTLAITSNNSVPSSPGSISGLTTICSNTSNTYSVSNVSGVTYNWTLPSGWTGTSTTNSINATANASAGNISVTATNSCGTSTASSQAISLNTTPTAPGTISGATSVCSGTTNTYSVTNVSGVTYNWTLPSGWTGTSTTNSINATSNASNGNIMVTATNTCGTSTASSQSITVNTAPTAPSAISGTTTICSGSTNTYSVTNVSGVTYNWTLPSGWSGSSTTNSISATASTSGGTISVSAQNSCGTGSPVATTITVNQLPTITVTSIPASGQICQGSSITLNASGGVYYIWDYTTSGASPTKTITPTVSTNYAVIGQSSAGCSDTVFYPIIVNPLPDTSITVNGNILISNEIGANSYQWYDCNSGMLSGETNQQFTAQTNGLYLVEIFNSFGCWAYSACINVSGIGLEDISKEEHKLYVFPNPSSGKFSLRSGNSETGFYEIVDISGKTVNQGKLTANETIVDLSGADEGVYLVKVQSASGINYAKIILSK